MEFLVLASAHFLALVSPGPDFFLILNTSMRLGLRHAVSVSVGIALANGLYIILAVLGLEALRPMGPIFQVLRYIGGGYLVYLGIMLLRSPRAIPQSEGRAMEPEWNVWRQFMQGMLSALLNPKNAVFYLSLFTVLVAPTTPLVRRAVYGVWMTVVVLTWDVGVATLFSSERMSRALGRILFLVEKGAGTCLVLCGLLMAVQRL